MRKPPSVIAFFACCALLLLSDPAGAKNIPVLSGRVVDEAGLIPPQAAAQIDRKLAAIETSTGAQAAVLTVESLEGEVLEDYSIRVAQSWRLGTKEKDNGVLFLIAKRDRKMRIEVGYGLEPTLTDARCRRILDNIVRPMFKSGQFAGGIDAGVDAIAAAIRGDAAADMPESAATRQTMPLPVLLFMLFMFVVVIGTFSLTAIFSKGGFSWYLFFFLMPFYLMFPSVMFPPLGGVLALILWIAVFLLMKFLLRSSDWGRNFQRRHPGLITFSTGSRQGGGSSWSSGSGFSGGGGSFGGGGSSGGW